MEYKKAKPKIEEEKSKNNGTKKDAETENKKTEETKEKSDGGKIEPPKKEIKKIKKETAIVNAKSVSVSAKHSQNICRFIKNKSIEKALKDLEDVLLHKKAIPMKGEHPHKKSIKKIASGAGRYPENATKHFVKLLKSLSANVNVNNLDNPIIKTAFSNIASRPRGRFGRWQRKRTHITIIVSEKNQHKKTGKKKNG